MSNYHFIRPAQLNNRFGVREEAVIREAEVLFTTMSAVQGLPDGDFGVTHYQEIHRHIFSELYEWAGSFRTAKLIVPSGQRDASLPHTQIASELTRVLTSLQKEDPSTMTVVQFSDRMASYYGKLYHIAPFDDGNARAARHLIEKYCDKHGMQMEWDKIPSDTMREASMRYLKGDSSALREVFRVITDYQDMFELYSVESVQQKMTSIIQVAGLNEQLLPSQPLLAGADLKSLAQYAKTVLAQDLARYATGDPNTHRDWDRTSIQHEAKVASSGSRVLSDALDLIASKTTPRARGPSL